MGKNKPYFRNFQILMNNFSFFRRMYTAFMWICGLTRFFTKKVFEICNSYNGQIILNEKSSSKSSKTFFSDIVLIFPSARYDFNLRNNPTMFYFSFNWPSQSLFGLYWHKGMTITVNTMKSHSWGPGHGTIRGKSMYES